MNDLTVTDTDRVHAIIDEVSRGTGAAFLAARSSAEAREVLERLARRAERTVRAVCFEYLNDLERL